MFSESIHSFIILWEYQLNYLPSISCMVNPFISFRLQEDGVTSRPVPTPTRTDAVDGQPADHHDDVSSHAKKPKTRQEPSPSFVSASFLPF